MPATTGQEARRAAVLGSPVAHSLSPVLHRAAYAGLGLGNWTYDRYRVDEQGIGDFLAGLDDRAGRWAGLSLTMPLKRAVIPLLDGISPTAASVEAVNTVLFTEDGRRTGDNTDVPGMVAALRERGIRSVESATVLGAGATASSALAALAQICADRRDGSEIGEITVYVRSAERAREMRGWGERLGVTVRTADWARAAEGLAAPLVISTTPAGATDGLAAAAPAAGGTLFDVLYDPWPTALAAAWHGPVLGGLDLLVHQAVLQVELMTGRGPAPLAAMRAAGEAELAARAG
ncbi:shikimate dehydrogenase [Streptomyces sp. NPDC006990]|uniref:shikimate dehydrogenase n=1 Tax=Streptomyces sp. NPDC006990 TaxID=3154481 RepID=UPI00345631A8